MQKTHTQTLKQRIRQWTQESKIPEPVHYYFCPWCSEWWMGKAEMRKLFKKHLDFCDRKEKQN